MIENKGGRLYRTTVEPAQAIPSKTLHLVHQVGHGQKHLDDHFDAAVRQSDCYLTEFKNFRQLKNANQKTKQGFDSPKIGNASSTKCEIQELDSKIASNVKQEIQEVDLSQSNASEDAYYEGSNSKGNDLTIFSNSDHEYVSLHMDQPGMYKDITSSDSDDEMLKLIQQRKRVQNEEEVIDPLEQYEIDQAIKASLEMNTFPGLPVLQEGGYKYSKV